MTIAPSAVTRENNMIDVNSKLNLLAENIDSALPLKIMIFGLGSVGSYLLDYLISWPEKNVEIHICGRSLETITQTSNILRVANLIRNNLSKPTIFHQVDLNNIENITEVIGEVAPDFVVNSSRVYSGLKYGSISWNNIRAYGLWSPLSVKFIRNIMVAYEHAGCSGIVINTSYPDVVNQWLKSAGLISPDFGSGNLNHLIPRIKFAAADQADIADSGAIDIVLATGHFHDVVISKEGQTEGVDPLVHISSLGRNLNLDMRDIYRKCAIPMPVDARRNMMNASSNFEIIAKITDAIHSRTTHVIHSPGVAGLIGGYPVRINFENATSLDKRITFVEDYFTLKKMEAHNRESIFLDGVENVSNGVLTYTDALQEKVKKSFGVNIPKHVSFEAIENMGEFLVEKIIKPALGAEV
jgi:hypothetical protein